MKKLLIVLAIVAIGVGFASCKKNCRCIGFQETWMEDELFSRIDVNTVKSNLTKKECDALSGESTTTSLFFTSHTKVTCTLE